MLCMVCKGLHNLAVEEANSAIVVELPYLECFILEDETRESLRMLSQIAFPANCDFHWTVIEPYGTRGYYAPNFSDGLSACSAVFNQKTSAVAAPSVMMIEVILDFDGQLFDTSRNVREWPEELRVSFESSVESANQQFVTRQPTQTTCLYRDLSAAERTTRQSFAVRSRMLSKAPQPLHRRQNPVYFTSGSIGTPKSIHVPLLHNLIERFMSFASGLNGFSTARTIMLPRHAYVPCTRYAWRMLLSHCDASTLILGNAGSIDEPYALARYLDMYDSGRWPLAALENVYCPDDVAKGTLSQAEFAGLMAITMGDRAGRDCVETQWHLGLST